MDLTNIPPSADYKLELKKNNVIAIVPTGNSMWPTLKHRKQSVIIEGKKEERLARLDVALYQRQTGMLVLHRVMKVEEDGYVMCGDSQFALERVKEEQILGKMLGFYQNKKYIDCNDGKYIKRVKKWYKRKRLRKLKVKLFYYSLALKNRLKKLFNKKDNK